MTHDHGGSTKVARWGMLFMVLCIVPLIALAAVSIFQIPINNVLLYGLVLLCPLSHVLMMAFSGHGGHDHHGPARADAGTARITEQHS